MIRPSQRVIVVGSVNIDHVIRCQALPAAGETVLATGRADGFGGKGGNQAAASARLGADTWLVAAVGTDAAGSAAIADLDVYGVHTECVRRVDGIATGEAIVLVDGGGENLIVVVPGANAALTDDDVEAQLAALRVSASDVLLVSAEIGTACVQAVIRCGSSTGARVVYNLAPARELPLPDAGFPITLVVNEVESMRVSGAQSVGEAVQGLADRVESLVVTKGASGAWLTDGVTTLDVPAPVAAVVDATGAGDVFCAGLATQLVRGRSLPDALALAVAAGSFAVTGAGARGALPTSDDLGEGAGRPGTHRPLGSQAPRQVSP